MQPHSIIMKTVGLRELKNRLSEYVQQVRSGESILVTDRGEVVAELRLPDESSVERSVPRGLLGLARRGLVTLGTPNHPSLYRRSPGVMTRQDVAELLDQERGKR